MEARKGTAEETQSLEEALAVLHRGHRMVIREMDRVCQKHGISFFLESGTLLGAVRHQEAIPWDDDADVAMLRKDFEKFRRIAQKELAPGFVYVEPDKLGKGIFDFVPRLVWTNSNLRPDSEEEQFYAGGIYNHLLIDIFIIDDVSDFGLYHKFCHILLILLYGLGLGHRYRLELEKYTGLSGMAVRILSSIGRLVPARKIVEWYDRVSQLETGKNPKKKRCYYSNYLFQDIGLIYEKKWFETTKRMTFGGDEFPVPEGSDPVLRKLYGDYWQLPPEDQRTCEHCIPGMVRVGFPEDEEE